MKKIICAILIVLTATLLVACNSSWKSTVSDYSGTVSSNGGFVVEKGEYIYFINGIIDSTSTNNFGEPTKGSLVRMKTADLGKASAESEIVIPKLIFSGNKGEGSGVYIFGDYVYYTSPCDDKNKQGVVRNTELEFLKTKLDGTDTTSIVTISSNSTPYRFVELGGNVFLTVYTTAEDDSSKNVLETYNCSTKEKTNTSDTVASYIFSKDLTSGYCYYTNAIHNDITDADEFFNRVMRYKLDGSENVEILNGAGSYTDKNHGIGATGVSFAPIAATGKQLYLSETFNVSGSATASTYLGVNEADIVTTASGDNTVGSINYAKLITLNNGTDNAAQIFSATSIYINLEAIVYFDSTYGVMKYDYTEKDGELSGRTSIYDNKDILSYTLAFVKDGFVYLTDSSDVFYRYNLSSLINLETGDVVANGTTEVKQINYYTANSATGWYLPEVVGKYFLITVTEDPYYSYVYAIDMTQNDEKTKEEIAEFAEDIKIEDREHIEARLKTRIGVISEADKTSLTTYMTDKFGEVDSSSQSSAS